MKITFAMTILVALAVVQAAPVLKEPTDHINHVIPKPQDNPESPPLYPEVMPEKRDHLGSDVSPSPSPSPRDTVSSKTLMRRHVRPDATYEGEDLQDSDTGTRVDVQPERVSKRRDEESVHGKGESLDGEEIDTETDPEVTRDADNDSGAEINSVGKRHDEEGADGDVESPEEGPEEGDEDATNPQINDIDDVDDGTMAGTNPTDSDMDDDD